MEIRNVTMTDTDGNIGYDGNTSVEQICGLVFDISAQSDFWTKGAGLALVDTFKDTVVEFNTLADAEEAGIKQYTGEKDNENVSKDLLNGVPYYHINHFFQMAGGSGRLFVAFADCSTDWNALVDMQKAASGTISQIGVWTEQNLWKITDASASTYNIQLVGALDAVGSDLANNYHAPVSIVLNANSAKVATSTTPDGQVVWSKIPKCVVDARYVTVLLGQETSEEVALMQGAFASCTPVGCVGLALGALSQASVAECIGWVQNFDLAKYFQHIELGFGDATIANQKPTSMTKFESLSTAQLDKLDDLGYVFLLKYTGKEGSVFFSGDQTCSNGDYRTIARNRAINKSRRNVRSALLPYVNSPIKVNPATGYLSAAQSTIFSNLVTSILQAMVDSEEISGFSVTIPSNQNILKNDTLLITYKMVPIGTSKAIKVTEGLSVTR